MRKLGNIFPFLLTVGKFDTTVFPQRKWTAAGREVQYVENFYVCQKP